MESTAIQIPEHERTRPASLTAAAARDYGRMERALAWLAANHERQPTLADAAIAAGMSPFHFQRLFTRWVGVSPKRYVQHLTLEDAKVRLRQAGSVFEAALDVGLSGPSRLHDLFVQIEAVTPGEYRGRGDGLTLRHGVHPSPFGDCTILLSPRGVCGLAFTGPGEQRRALDELARGWERARLVHDPEATAAVAARAFATEGDPGEAPLRVLVRGTAFQLRVWRALLEIPPGRMTTYAGLAGRVGAPRASRAVGSAAGRNPVAYLIPCHRVIRANGALGGYRWGAGRKLAMLSREAARA